MVQGEVNGKERRMKDNNDYSLDFFAPRNTSATIRRCEQCHYYTANGEAGIRWRGNCQNVEGMAWNEADDFCSRFKPKK